MSDKTGELVGELYQRAAEQMFALEDAVTPELLQAALRALGEVDDLTQPTTPDPKVSA